MYDTYVFSLNGKKSNNFTKYITKYVVKNWYLGFDSGNGL